MTTYHLPESLLLCRRNRRNKPSPVDLLIGQGHLIVIQHLRVVCCVNYRRLCVNFVTLCAQSMPNNRTEKAEILQEKKNRRFFLVRLTRSVSNCHNKFGWRRLVLLHSIRRLILFAKVIAVSLVNKFLSSVIVLAEHY